MCVCIFPGGEGELGEKRLKIARPHAFPGLLRGSRSLVFKCLGLGMWQVNRVTVVAGLHPFGRRASRSRLCLDRSAQSKTGMAGRGNLWEALLGSGWQSGNLEMRQSMPRISIGRNLGFGYILAHTTDGFYMFLPLYSTCCLACFSFGSFSGMEWLRLSRERLIAMNAGIDIEIPEWGKNHLMHTSTIQYHLK